MHLLSSQGWFSYYNLIIFLNYNIFKLQFQ